MLIFPTGELNKIAVSKKQLFHFDSLINCLILAAPCEAPLIYNDCYQKRCEPDCATFSDPRACPKVNDMCFPGCYCPAGYVREGNNCIPPSSCRNCECDLLPHLTYITYDEANFTISGNCVYVMSRDVITKENKEHQFQASFIFYMINE